MNDRIPGACWSNPIWYKGYRIYVSDNWPEFEFVHDNYDGAEDAHDNRCGWAKSVEAAKADIDERE